MGLFESSRVKAGATSTRLSTLRFRGESQCIVVLDKHVRDYLLRAIKPQ